MADQRPTDDADIVNNLALGLGDATELEDAVRLCVRATRGLNDLDIVGVYLLERKTGALILAHSEGTGEDSARTLTRFEAGSDRVALVERGTPVYTVADELPDATGVRERERMHAVGMVPMLDRGRVIGCINVASRSQDELPNDVRQTIETIAALVGTALARLETEAELQRSVTYYRSLIDNALEVVSIWDTNGTILYNSRSVEQTLGYTPEEIKGKSALELLHPDDLPALLATIERGLPKPGLAHHLEARILHKDGMYRIIEGYGRLIEDPTGQQRILLSSRDVTERKAAEAELRRANEELRRARDAAEKATRDLLTAQDEERRRIARELHDEAGQWLTSLIARVRALEHALNDATTRDQLRELRGLSELTLQEIRRVSHGLYPSVLDTLGFAAALEHYVRDYTETHGIPVELQVVGLGPSKQLSSATQLSLYRIVQEALTNVAKHSRCDAASVVVHHAPRSVRLLIEDNGRGFNPEATREHRGWGLGLTSITDRASLLGGGARIESALGEGTTVVVEVPTED